LLKAFIAKIPHARRPISILKLLVGDLDTAVVERERNNIDILIEISAIKLVIVIENKVGAAVADGQLGRYKQFVRSKFSGWHQLFVLLTVDGDQPDDDTYDPEYLCFSYVDLAGLLTRHLQERRNSISDDIALILRSYVDTLRRLQIARPRASYVLLLQIGGASKNSILVLETSGQKRGEICYSNLGRTGVLIA
jgi:hypothetical protein